MNVQLTRSLLSASKRSLQLNTRRNLSLTSASRPATLLTAHSKLQKAHASTQADLANEALAELSASEATSSQTQVPTTPTQTPSNGTNGNGLNGAPITDALSSVSEPGVTDWSRSYYGLSVEPFSKDVAEVLLAPLEPMDVEVKPGSSSFFTLLHSCRSRYCLFLDGLIYLPEIKYRRILNKAFGPGGWGLAPRSETNVGPKIVSREYALVCLGRYVPPGLVTKFRSSILMTYCYV